MAYAVDLRHCRLDLRLEAAAKGQYLVAIIAFQMTGALVGFLPLQLSERKTVLADAGSICLLLARVLANSAHYYSRATPNAWRY